MSEPGWFSRDPTDGGACEHGAGARPGRVERIGWGRRWIGSGRRQTHPLSLPIARRSAVARRGQLLLIGVAVALSVAFSVASFEFAALLSQALGTATSSSVTSIEDVPSGAVVLTARTSAATTSTALDDELIGRVRAIDGVLLATGTFDQPVSFELRPREQPDRPAALRGVVFSAAFETPWTLVSGRAPIGPDEVAVDVGGAVVGQVAEGQFADLELPTGRRRVHIVGIASLGGSAEAVGDATPALSDAHVLFDPRSIGPLLGAVGRVDRITVLPGPGVDRDELAGRIGTIVGRGVRVTATSDPNAVAQQTVATLDDGVQQGTQAFALLTVVVAIIVVANVFAVILAPRTRELALLRLVGASRRQLVRWLLGEALIVGMVASVVGFGLGVPIGAFAAGLVQTGSAPVGAMVTGEMLVVAPVVGMGVTLIGALLPARRASSVAPIDALTDRGDGRPSVNRTVIRVLGGGIGLIGGGLARFVLGPARAVAAMASSNVRRRPAATAAAASTLLVGLVLVGAVSVAGASVRAGLASQFETESRADAYVERRGVVRVDRDSLVARINEARLPIAGAAEVVSVDGFLVAPKASDNRVVAGTLASIDPVIDLDVRSGAIAGPGSAMLSVEVASSLGVGPGDDVTLRSTSGAERQLTVSGTYANTAFYGPAIVDISDAQAIGADGTFERLAVRFGDDRFDRRATRQLNRVATRFPRVNVSSPEEFAALNTSVADTVLRIIAVLLGCAIAIGAVGLAATLSLGVLERSTELSRLRAIGASKVQVQSLVTLEAVLVCLGAAVWGLGIGALIGWFGLRLAPPDLIAEQVVPWRLLIGVGVGSIALGAAVSLLPARRAANLPPIRAATQ